MSNERAISLSDEEFWNPSIKDGQTRKTQTSSGSQALTPNPASSDSEIENIKESPQPSLKPIIRPDDSLAFDESRLDALVDLLGTEDVDPESPAGRSDRSNDASVESFSKSDEDDTFRPDSGKVDEALDTAELPAAPKSLGFEADHSQSSVPISPLALSPPSLRTPLPLPPSSALPHVSLPPVLLPPPGPDGLPIQAFLQNVNLPNGSRSSTSTPRPGVPLGPNFGLQETMEAHERQTAVLTRALVSAKQEVSNLKDKCSNLEQMLSEGGQNGDSPPIMPLARSKSKTKPSRGDGSHNRRRTVKAIPSHHSPHVFNADQAQTLELAQGLSQDEVSRAVDFLRNIDEIVWKRSTYKDMEGVPKDVLSAENVARLIERVGLWEHIVRNAP